MRRTRLPKTRHNQRTLADRVNGMSFKQLDAFIGAGLSGSLPIAGDYNAFPSAFLLEVFHKLNPGVRQVFEDVLIKDLSDLAHNPTSSWRSERGDELLLLIGTVFADSHRANDPVDLLLYIVKDVWVLRDDPLNLHWRAAQTLISIRYRAQPLFWMELYQKGGTEYGGLTFAGLVLSSLENALEWLKSEVLNDRAWNEFIAMLPLLNQQYGADQLARNFRKILLHIPESHIDEFRKLTASLHIPLISDILYGLDKVKIMKLAAELEIEIPENVNEGMARQKVEHWFRSEVQRQHRFVSTNPDIEVIGVVADLMSERNILYDFRDYFAAYAEQIVTEVGPEDALYFAQQVLKIKDTGFNITQELPRFARGHDDNQ